MLTVAACVVVVAAATTVLLATRHNTQRQPPREAVRAAQETRSLFRSMPTARADDHTALMRALDSAALFNSQRYTEDGHEQTDYEEAPVLSGAERESLLDTAAEFISLRAGGDADAYAEWMRSRGYTLKDRDHEIDGVRGLTVRHPGYVLRFRLASGRDPVEDDTAWSMFRDAFIGQFRKNNTKVIGIASGPGAVEVWVGTIREPFETLRFGALDVFRTVLRARVLGVAHNSADHNLADGEKTHWFAREQYDGWPFWTPTATYNQIFEKHGAVLTARLHCILRTQDGGVLPAAMILYYDPDSRLWHLPDRREAFIYVNTYAIPMMTSPVF